MLKPFNLHHDNVRPVTTTCAEPPRILPQVHLSPEDHRQYRQSVGQLIWASLIRPDLQYPAKTLTRHLQAPSSFDLKNLKHTLRYIKGSQHLRLVLGKDLHRHAGQPLDQLHPLDIKCFTDSDWAGDQESQKSTSGFIISILNTPLAFSSKTCGNPREQFIWQVQAKFSSFCPKTEENKRCCSIFCSHPSIFEFLAYFVRLTPHHLSRPHFCFSTASVCNVTS